MMKRMGNFALSYKIIEKQSTLVEKIMSQCIIVRAEAMYAYNNIHYTAISDHFDEVPLGMIIPEYEVHILKRRWMFWKKEI